MIHDNGAMRERARILWRVVQQSLFFRVAVVAAVALLPIVAVWSALAGHESSTLLQHGVRTTATVEANDSYPDPDPDSTVTRGKLLTAFTDRSGTNQTRWIMEINTD